jgi:serine/threonine-protein kinase
LVTPSVRLVEPLGAGGMASVWTADHLTLRTRVVVKFISNELVSNDEARARFSREAAAAAAVKSPHVVQVFDHGIIDGAPFIVMELLEGEDLRARLERSGPLCLQDVEIVVSHTCKALGQAHRAGIVHRDIKPDNIFLSTSEDGEFFVKLLDFGIAKKDDGATSMGATRTGAVMGTPYYMSPEQVVGARLDLRTDLWSLGVVAFEAMTGAKAFDGETLGALAVAVTHGPMPVPSRSNPLLPPAVDEWFARACSRDVAGRFSSAKELAAAFRAASTGAAPTGSLPRLSVTAPLVGHRARVVAPSAPQSSALRAVVPPAADPQMMSTTTSGVLGNQLPMSSPRPFLVAAVVTGVVLLALGGGTILYATKRTHIAQPSGITIASTGGATLGVRDVAPEANPTLVPLAIAPSAQIDLPPAVTTVAGKTTTHPPSPVAMKPDSGMTKPATSATAKADCNPPFYFDSSGIKVFKKECMQ